ncbi:MAG TPA: undecaprenyl-diphosphate phosphatase [Bacteroidales bacterium]|nr:undecaprenyl-diphosphate phosphatase [Bacteroidales bacterium]HQB22716.1 undecaprenyl-diphosphate phosphatase [Bacteroidales bacterium]
MEWFEALILGLIQGLTEFLPVSSSAHLEIGKALFGIKGEENFYFSIMVHGATVLSTLVVFWKDILKLFKGLFKFQYNEETSYIFKICVSMIPVLIVGLLFKDHIEKLFAGNSFVFIGSMLVVTAALLFFTYFFKNKKQRDINYLDAFIIGISQAIAVVPGISRSGATIATGLINGNKKEEIAKFSFLMVLIPILGENFLDIVGGTAVSSGIPTSSLIIGFLAAFVSGLIACKTMINIVKKGKLYWFAIYCLIVGVITIFFVR